MKLIKGLQGANKQPPIPPCNTRAIPGTEEKIRVMVWRVANGYAPPSARLYGGEEPNMTVFFLCRLITCVAVVVLMIYVVLRGAFPKD